LTNLVRAGLARAARRPYTPMPTIYDGLFPDGTLLTAPTRKPPPQPDPPAAANRNDQKDVSAP
jgi:hypothetical protein